MGIDKFASTATIVRPELRKKENTLTIIEEQIEKLRELIRNKQSIIVAFSGGVDSSVIAKIAYEELKDNSMAVTIDSDTFSRRELKMSRQTAKEIGISHQVMKTSELDDEKFVSNPINRCYFCKKEEMNVVNRVALDFGFKVVAFGVTASDSNEHRPGIRALTEKGFFLPLVDAGIQKRDIPAIARSLGLKNFAMPSTTCLASRIPYGLQITKKKLEQIEAAEDFFYQIGLNQVRVRHYEDTARIEVEPDRIDAVMNRRAEVIGKLKELGFTYVTLDLEGYRSGSMDEILTRS